MAAIPIPRVLAKSRVAPPSEVIGLENVLENIDFAKQVTEWASQTGAGQAKYSGVGVVRDLPFASTKPEVVATISCYKTPKANGFASWTCKDAFTWTYTTASKQQIPVKIEPRDTLRRLALVGNCVATEVDYTEAGKPESVHFTLGLVLRQRQLQGATTEIKWAVLVSHAFATKAEIAVDKPTQGVPRHDSWKMMVCSGPNTDPKAQCEICKLDKCIQCKPNFQWAAGKQDIIRSMNWDVDMSLVRLPSEPTPPIVPLDIGKFKLEAQELKSKEFVEERRDEFVDLLKKAELSLDTFAGPDFIKNVLLKFIEGDGSLPYAFKKGSQTSWTWGVITKADNHRVWIRSMALEYKDHLLVDSGDCGSIWFVIDAFTDQDRPVIKPMAIECVALNPKLNQEGDGEPDFQIAGADFYLPTLRDQVLGDDVSLPGMAGCKANDLYYAAGDSFCLTI